MSRSLRSRNSLVKVKPIEIEERQQQQIQFLTARKKSKLKKSINKKLSISSENFVMCKVGKFDTDYEIIDKLGQGSFGTVYRVKHKKLKLERALKTIQKKSNSLSQTFDEIQVLKKLDHSNILKIYEFYEAKDSYFIVTQIFDGNQLFDQILDDQKLSQKITAKVIREILIALNYTHSQGIAHRDIKPENILIKDIGTNKMKIKIIDWGLGTLLTGTYKSNRFCGTPDYAAPQTYKGMYTTQCDMWSLGVLVYIMLTGQMPFKGKNTQDTMLNAQKGVLNFRRRNFNLISGGAKQFILSLLQKDPKKRMTAAEALENPWIKEYKDLKGEPQYLKQTLVRLKSINVTNRFGLAVINFVNNHMSSSEEKEKLQQIFKYLDENGDGVLSNEQLIEGYTRLYGKQLGTKIAEETFLKLDVNHNGSLQFSEFVAFGLERKQQEQKIRLHQAFNLFDLNKDGQISFKEIGKILQGTVDGLSQEQLNELISDFDENGDNEIDFEEFLKCVSSIYEKMSEKKHSQIEQKKQEKK